MASRAEPIPLEVGQVWDGNVQGGRRRALFRITAINGGVIHYDYPLGQRLDGYSNKGKLPEGNFRLYANYLLDPETVKSLGG